MFNGVLADSKTTKENIMSVITRKEFILKSTAGLAGTLLVPHFLHATPENNFTVPGPIGFQSWVVRELIEKDFPGTMKMMAGMGFQSVEMCSPPGYAAYGFGSLQKLTATELKKIINDAGITCTSCHYGFEELKKNTQERIDFAKELGLTQMVVSMFSLPKNPSLGDWRKACDELNVLAEQSKKSGIQMGYHNHNHEFEKLEGQLIYDVVLGQLDPTLVKMQFQVWVIIAGYRAADYFRKYPGRFISAHLSDWPGTGDKQAPLGKGTVDWNEFFDACKVGGVKNVFVEMDVALLKESAAYLKG